MQCAELPNPHRHVQKDWDLQDWMQFFMTDHIPMTLIMSTIVIALFVARAACIATTAVVIEAVVTVVIAPLMPVEKGAPLCLELKNTLLASMTPQVLPSTLVMTNLLMLG